MCCECPGKDTGGSGRRNAIVSYTTAVSNACEPVNWLRIGVAGSSVFTLRPSVLLGSVRRLQLLFCNVYLWFSFLCSSTLNLSFSFSFSLMVYLCSSHSPRNARINKLMDKIDGLRMRFRAAARVAQHKGVRDQHVTSAGPCATHKIGRAHV